MLLPPNARSVVEEINDNSLVPRVHVSPNVHLEYLHLEYLHLEYLHLSREVMCVVPETLQGLDTRIGTSVVT